MTLLPWSPWFPAHSLADKFWALSGGRRSQSRRAASAQAPCRPSPERPLLLPPILSDGFSWPNETPSVLAVNSASRRNRLCLVGGYSRTLVEATENPSHGEASVLGHSAPRRRVRLPPGPRQQNDLRGILFQGAQVAVWRKIRGIVQKMMDI